MVITGISDRAALQLHLFMRTSRFERARLQPCPFKAEGLPPKAPTRVFQQPVYPTYAKTEPVLADSRRQFPTHGKHFAHHLLDVIRRGAMIDDAGPQREASMNRRVGQEYLSSANHALQNLLVQRVAIGASIGPRSIAEANCAERDGSHEFEFGLLRNETGQQLRVRYVVADRLAKIR